MKCTICNGIRKVCYEPREYDQDPGGETPCEHCSGTGVEPPDLGAYELTKAKMLKQQASRDDAPPGDTPTKGLYGYGRG